MNATAASPRSRTEDLIEAFEGMLSPGHHSATQGSELAAALGVSERTIRALAGELIDRGIPVGSTCSADAAGYFLCESEEDFALALANLRPRALAILHRWSALKRAAANRLAEPTVLRLFDLDGAS